MTLRSAVVAGDFLSPTAYFTFSLLCKVFPSYDPPRLSSLSYLCFSISVLPNIVLVTLPSPFSPLFVHSHLLSHFCPLSCILSFHLFISLLLSCFLYSFCLLSDISPQFTALLYLPLDIFFSTLFLWSLSSFILSPDLYLHIYVCIHMSLLHSRSSILQLKQNNDFLC